MSGDEAPNVPELVKSALYARWQEPPVSRLTVRQVEMRRLADSMRIIMERIVATMQTDGSWIVKPYAGEPEF